MTQQLPLTTIASVCIAVLIRALTTYKWVLNSGPTGALVMEH